ncbi:MAG: hypothetical protein PHN49_10615 [Candidatus Omnitrophica bacterium]|nr:hypothetical protein [Candidatus Omnitrophota bacterium]
MSTRRAKIGFSDTKRFDIPSHLGTIKEIWNPGLRKAQSETPNSAELLSESPSVILIQDAHGHYEAQKKIQAILEFLESKQALKGIYLEGGVGKLNPDLLSFFEEKDLNAEVAEKLTRLAEIGGPELFLLEHDIPVYGVEDPALYVQNVLGFRKVSEQEAFSKAYLDKILLQITSQASKAFNKDLLDFFKLWLRYEKSEADLQVFFTGLIQTATKHLGLDVQNPGTQLDWPMLMRFSELGVREARLDRDQAAKERQTLIGWAVQAGLDAQTVSFLRRDDRNVEGVRRSSQYSDLRAEWETFFRAAAPKGFRFQDYPRLIALEGYRILESEINAVAFFDEIQTLEGRILSKLAVAPEEKEILKHFRRWLLLGKLFRLQMTRTDFKHLRRIEKQFSRPSKSQELQKPFDALFRDAIAYYRTALERDKVIVDQLVRQAASPRKGSAVLVAGGFHTEGVTALLRDKQIAYAVVTPQILTTDEDKSYRDAMLSQKAAVNFFESTTRWANFMNPVSDWSKYGLPMARREKIIRDIIAFGERRHAKLNEVNADVIPVNRSEARPIKDLADASLEVPPGEHSFLYMATHDDIISVVHLMRILQSKGFKFKKVYMVDPWLEPSPEGESFDEYSRPESLQALVENFEKELQSSLKNFPKGKVVNREELYRQGFQKDGTAMTVEFEGGLGRVDFVLVAKDGLRFHQADIETLPGQTNPGSAFTLFKWPGFGGRLESNYEFYAGNVACAAKGGYFYVIQADRPMVLMDLKTIGLETISDNFKIGDERKVHFGGTWPELSRGALYRKREEVPAAVIKKIMMLDTAVYEFYTHAGYYLRYGLAQYAHPVS